MSIIITGNVERSNWDPIPLTFSVERSVSLSYFLCVKTMVKTAWDLLLVSFMLVAATVLKEERIEPYDINPSLIHLFIHPSTYSSIYPVHPPPTSTDPPTHPSSIHPF